MNNQNNPYPDMSDQPLMGNQNQQPQAQPPINNPYPINQQQNQGYMPPHQHFPRNSCITQLLPLLLPSPTTTTLNPTPTTTKIRDSTPTRVKGLCHPIMDTSQGEASCVPFAEDRPITSPRRCQEEWPGSGASASSSSQAYSAASPSVWTHAWIQSWCAWSASAWKAGRRPNAADSDWLSHYIPINLWNTTKTKVKADKTPLLINSIIIVM